MNISSNCLPENIRKCLPKEDRKELKAPVQAEADARFIARAEKQLQENIARLLTQRNICFFRQRMDRKTSGTVGWPDFTFAIRGLACAVECKTQDGRLTPEQTNVMSALQADGWHTWIARSEADFVTWLKAMEAANG